MRTITHYILPILLITGMSSCSKLVEIDAPIDTITTSQVFDSEEQAKQAMAGIYTLMMNGKRGTGQVTSAAITHLTSLSADDLNCLTGQANGLMFAYNANKLNAVDANALLWTGLYEIIFAANSVMEGIQRATSSLFPERARIKMLGECRFIRAYCYFYLTNLYGEVPLVTITDYNKTRVFSKSPVTAVYKQMVEDLLFAKDRLPPVNANTAGERIYPGKWAAAALLARTYLFMGEYNNAWKYADSVIRNTDQISLEAEPDKVFLTKSKEAIWQLKQTSSNTRTNNATFEGLLFIPSASFTGTPFYNALYVLSDQLLNAFEPGDKRKSLWVGATAPDPMGLPGQFYFPHKYKTGAYNRVINGVPTEFYMMCRLAEQYLIRAEAAAHGEGSLSAAIDDLNILRKRADISELPDDLDQTQVLAAIAQERRVEFFCEWGHRWFDLKRTNQASIVLSQLPVKQPWQGDYQLLYPIPPGEIESNSFLKQNPVY